jgi:hypothetical protein
MPIPGVPTPLYALAEASVHNLFVPSFMAGAAVIVAKGRVENLMEQRRKSSETP